jgi:hypothetical protein
MSVNKGSTIAFKIDTTASSYSIGIFRFGYYQGNGARKITSIPPSAILPRSQPACLTDVPTGLLDCGNWAVSASWSVPTTAVSGVYMAVLVRPDTGGASQIPFVVRDDSSHSDILFQTDDTTWQAYNQFGGNSLYLGSAPSSDGRAYKVSYNRPFATRGQTSGYGTSNFFFYAEYPMIRFLESNGYDMSYESGIDADRSGSLIKNHKTLLTAGHDEYWSGGMRSNVEAARAAGVNLAFFSGNEVFWKIRFENSIDGSGTPYRTLVCYKETKAGAAIDPQDPPTWTGTWRDPTLSPPADGGRPENALLGTIFTVNRGSAALTVPATYSKLRLWRNTSVATLGSGQTATFGTNTLGYEWDEDLDNGFRPAGLFDLSSTTVSVPERLQDYGNTYAPGTAVHHLTFYKTASGSKVFSAGTVQWAWGLDTNHDASPDSGPATVDVRMQQAMINLLADLGSQPATIIAGLTAAVPSIDTTAPVSTITSPTVGANITPGSTITVSGTASDSGGGVVAGVEVSTDGGTTWHPAVGTTSWSYQWSASIRSGSVTIRSRAVDDSGNLETPSVGIKVTVTAPTTPVFIGKSSVINAQTVIAPPGIASGDLLLAILEIDSNPPVISAPTGWSQVLDTPAATGTGATFHLEIWRKIATSTEPSSYTFGVSGNPWTDIGILDYAYVNTAAPIDAISGRDAGITAIPTTPSITTTQANEMLVAVFSNYGSVSFAAGSGMTQRYNFDSNTAQDAVQAVAGSSGTRTATASGAGPTAAAILALKPGVPDTTPPSVTMTAPSAGATVSGNTVTVSANASKPGGAVAWVQFLLDGATLGSQVTAPPYTILWDSTTAANAGHTLSAKATDTGGNQATSAPVAVTVSNIPPVITNVAASGITTTGATITWTTDIAATSQVEYGTSATYGLSIPLESSLVTSHSQALTGLSSTTLYHFRVKSSNSGGVQAASGDNTFTTAAPAPPPVISNVAAGTITTTGTTITWMTNVASSSQVDYGTSISYSSSSARDSTPVTTHSQVLNGLAPATTYHYRVKSADSSGNLGTSGDNTFTTATPPPPLISNVQVTSITGNGATITWSTDIASDTTVQYGTNTTYGSAASTAAPVTGHSQALTGLAASTLYHYKVSSKDAYNQVSSSGDNTFTTSATLPTAPSFRSTSIAINGTTVNKPSGAAAGDLLLATLEVDGDPVTVSGPAGWILLLDTLAGRGTISPFHAQVWYKVATAGEPASYTWSVPAGVWVDIGLLDYVGVNGSSPIDASDGRDAGSVSNASTNAVVTTQANDLVVALFINYQTATWTAGPGTTKRYDFDGNTAEDVVQASVGITGAKSAAASVTGSVSAQIVALKGI